jgi:hypothetical protein
MKKEHDNKINEPLVEYGPAKKRVAIFNSFEEAAEADCEFYRNLTPVERVQIHYELSIMVHGQPKAILDRRLSFEEQKNRPCKKRQPA